MTDHLDPDLLDLEAHGWPPLPPAATSGHVRHDGADIWFASFGDGPVLILLHGGLGHSGNFAFQVPDLVAAGYCVVTIDSRGHGRSSRDDRPYAYRQMAGDTRAVMDHLGIARAAIVGWSDGADTGLLLAQETPERVTGLLFFACNVDASGSLPFVFTPIIGRIYNQHVKDYAALSATPDAFQAFADVVGEMQRGQPNLGRADLEQIAVPVWSVLGGHDEFIRPEHATYIADAIPGATLRILPGVSHFAPLQNPALFNATVLDFAGTVLPRR